MRQLLSLAGGRDQVRFHDNLFFCVQNGSIVASGLCRMLASDGFCSQLVMSCIDEFRLKPTGLINTSHRSESMFFLYNRVSLLPGTYDRYLIRELLLTLLAVSVALVLVLASNRLIRYLGEVVGGRLPGDLVLTLLGYKSLEYLDQLLPIALYLAILLLLGRLYRDREMAVLAAGGVATSRLLRPLLFVALPMMLVQLAVSFQFAPWAVRQQVAVEDELARRSDIAALQPGRFLESRRGFRVLYVEAMDENQEQFEQLFVHQLHLDGRFSVYASSRGGVVVDRENGVRYLEMEEGAI